MRIIAATGNAHKLIEIRAITDEYGFELVSQADVGLGGVDIEETGTTFEENSFIKADAICRLSGSPAIADDSGLAVDILGGAPGIYSARYAGAHGDDAANRRKLLEALKDVPLEKRRARFCCVITLLWPDGKKIIAEGSCPGHIAFSESGDHGFGYDSIFIPDGYSESFGVIPEDIKNRISHRAEALKELRKLL